MMACTRTVERQDDVIRLCGELDSHGWNARIFDDIEMNGCWWNARRCWFTDLKDSHSHVAVIQEDVSLCPNFKKVLESFMFCFPNDLLAFFPCCPWLSTLRKTSNSYYSFHQIAAPFIVAPEWMRQEFKEWCMEYPFGTDTPKEGDDLLWSIFAYSRRHRIVSPSTYFIKHEGEKRSLLGHIYVHVDRPLHNGRVRVWTRGVKFISTLPMFSITSNRARMLFGSSWRRAIHDLGIIPFIRESK